MEKAIIIFVRNPEPGKVKTRLAREIGDSQTLQVYTELLEHTHAIVCNLPCDKFVYYADAVNENDLWENEQFNKKLQEGETLGDRMMQAFFELFEQGYSKIVIIGSDCPGLTALIIDHAFKKLDSNDVVIGPSDDGGYYLLGLTHLIPALFIGKQWSTDTVLAETITSITQLKKPYTFLPELYDIDTLEDLNRYLKMPKP